MLKKIVNEAFCTLRITTTGPLFVKSGHASVSGPDMTPVLTWRNGKQEVFIPGSSLKGVFRSHIEKIVCSLKPRVVCYPFELSDTTREKIADLKQLQSDFLESCGGVFNQYAKRNEESRRRLEERTDLVYAASCPTCRLFGSTGFIGRIAIGDAYLASEKEQLKEQRDGLGIDRLTGEASHGAKFELEVVSADVTFETDIHLRNFEIWQLGMLFVVLQDMAVELIRLGSGRSRGLGQVKAEISLEGSHGRPGGFVTSTIRDGKEPLEQLWGLGRWLNDESYGTSADDFVTVDVERITRGIRTMRSFTGADLNALRDATIDAFVGRMQAWSGEHMREFAPFELRWDKENGGDYQVVYFGTDREIAGLTKNEESRKISSIINRKRNFTSSLETVSISRHHRLQRWMLSLRQMATTTMLPFVFRACCFIPGNLEADEFGALVLAVTLEDQMRHKIGYGKPLGLGSVYLQPMSLTLIDYASRYTNWKAEQNKKPLEGQAMWDVLYRHIDEFSEMYMQTLAMDDLRRIWLWPPESGVNYYYPSKREWFDKDVSIGKRIRDTRNVP